MNTVADLWADFEQRIVPKGAPAVQRIEMRRAFYSGARALLRLMNDIGEVSDDAGAAILDGIDQELDAFGKAVLEGRA